MRSRSTRRRSCRPRIRTCFDIPAASRWPTPATTSADPRVGRSGRHALPLTRICPLISDFWESVFGKGLEERKAAVVAPNWQALMGLAIAGAGITVLPRCYCEGELQRGELVELIQPRNPPLNRLYLAYTARNIRLPRNRAVRDTLLKAKAQW